MKSYTKASSLVQGHLTLILTEEETGALQARSREKGSSGNMVKAARCPPGNSPRATAPLAQRWVGTVELWPALSVKKILKGSNADPFVWVWQNFGQHLWQLCLLSDTYS